MKKTIFAIWGEAKQGKSSTVKEVARLILNQYSSQATTIPHPADFSVADVKFIIHIGNVKIGIEGQGDPNSRLFESLKEYSNDGCDIIICSTRTSGATVNAVSDLHASHGYDIVWTTNYRSVEKPHDILNQMSAEHIFRIVQEVISNRL